MRILLLCSAFNGLTQRAWIALRAAGHDVTVELATSADAIRTAAALFNPELIICPFLRERVPSEVWTRYRTIIIHPGPVGDRGPSSLDWAITDGEAHWGVTALEAVEEMDAGPIWATRQLSLPPAAVRKGSLYNGAVADAAIELIADVVIKAADPAFQPDALDPRRPDVIGRLRPSMRQADRQFSWSDATDTILRRIAAADGSPGVRTTLDNVPVHVFDAHRGPALPGRPGAIVGQRLGAVLVRTGDGGVWIGQVRTEGGVKLPATMALAHRVAESPAVFRPVSGEAETLGRQEISYRRRGDVGVLQFDFYNGAMSTSHCRRLRAALRDAIRQPTKVLVLQGGEVYSNGIHLNVVHAAPSPTLEAWRNIHAIDDVCREIITCASQLVVASIGGNAGAGGVMLPLGADHVIVRDGVVLNPHYQTMGLYGSEYWTYVLPRRVGDDEAARLTQECLPIGASEAARIGLADDVVAAPSGEFEGTVLDFAARLAGRDDYARLLQRKLEARQADERRKPLEAYRVEELAEMSRDIFDDRRCFSAERLSFVTKQRPSSTPARIATHRSPTLPITDCHDVVRRAS